MNKEELLKSLEYYQIPCDAYKCDLLFTFMNETLLTNEKFNLTAITDRGQFVEKMIFDSALALHSYDFSNKKAIDVGTGAGYPGMVLKILSPDTKMTLLDSTGKKIDYLKQFALANNIEIDGVTARAEDYARKHREEFDIATARAIANLSILLEIISPMLKVGGVLVALKGPGYEKEINESKKAFEKLSLEIDHIQEFVLPESNEDRAIIVIKKKDKTKPKYPRDYSVIKKQPL